MARGEHWEPGVFGLADGRVIMGLMSPGIRVPYHSIWSGASPTTTVTPGGPFRVRQSFFSAADGQILAARFFRDITDPANHVAYIVKRDVPGARALLRAAAFPHNAAGAGPAGWQTVYFAALPILANDWYDLVVEWSGGLRSYTPGVLSATRYVNVPLVVPQDNVVDPFGNLQRNGGFAATLNFNPNGADGGNLEGIDINFLPA